MTPSRELPAEREPDGNITAPHHWWLGILMMTVGFIAWQPTASPIVGATVAILGLLVALDDWLSHALGVWTPLDAAFHRAMQYPRLRRAYVAVASWLPG